MLYSKVGLFIFSIIAAVLYFLMYEVVKKRKIGKREIERAYILFLVFLLFFFAVASALDFLSFEAFPRSFSSISIAAWTILAWVALAIIVVSVVFFIIKWLASRH